MSTELYPGIAFSPQATLTNNLGAADTIIRVSDVSAFPPAPNLATIGTDEEGETILYTAKTADALSGCQRGIEGEARTWAAGELIGRNFTAKDHADLIAAVSETRDAAVSAKEAADEADNAAKNAQEAAEIAQNAAENAQTAAEAAEAQAQTAADTADTASQAAQAAQRDAQDAKSAAEQAETAAGAAGSAAANAAVAANNAQNTAADAKRIAEDAARTAQAAGGLYPQIIVFAAAGAVVTCTDGARRIEKTADNALVVFDVPDYGDWTVSALRDDIPSDTVTVTVDTAKQYTVALAFFVSTITVMVEAGSTVVCEGGGKTQTKTSDGSVVFTVISAATYTVTATTGDETVSGTVEITASEQAKAITLEYFRSTITVTVESGSTVVCEGGGWTQTKTSDGSVVFTVISAATYTVTATTGDETVSGTVEITASEQAKTITLEYFRSSITVNVAAGAYVTCTDGTTALNGNSNGSVVFEVHHAAAWRIAASMNGRTVTGTVTITASGQIETIMLEFFTATITVNVEAGSTVTCTKGIVTQTETSTGSVVFTVEEAGTYTITAAKNGQMESETVQLTASGQSKTVSIVYVKIYGVSWDGSATTKLSRTDDAGLFADPASAVGNGAGFSPFDDCYPWSGMTKVTDGENILVKIPKYWVKVQHNPFRVQIANKAMPGYQVSPAHRDRRDGYGERDVVYIGRYECDGSFMSKSGQETKVSTTLAAFRSGIAALGAGYWQADFALQLTLWYLYIVEFADWNGQTAIGKGNCESFNVINTGSTDSMTYHTGRVAGMNRDTAIQYRNIENLWGNVNEWRDGIIFYKNNICTYNNPADFKDEYNGTGAVVRSNKLTGKYGYIKVWEYDTDDPSFIYPSETIRANLTYVPDYCSHIDYVDYAIALDVGGGYSEGIDAGPFCLNGQYAPNTEYKKIGSRLQKLPRST